MKNICPASNLGPFLQRMTLLLAVVLLLCTAASLLRAQDQNSAQQTIETVHGVVVNSIDKKPVARVLVTTGDQRMATMTDSEGRFSFAVRRRAASANSSMQAGIIANTGVPGLGTTPQTIATIGLMVRRPGYQQIPSMVQLTTDQQGAIQPITVEIIPGGVLRGTVQTSSGETPANVSVQLLHKQIQDGRATWMIQKTVQTNGHGTYQFSDLLTGDYKVMTAQWSAHGRSFLFEPSVSSGFLPAFNAAAGDLASAPSIHIRAGDAVEEYLTLREATFYPVSVPVAGGTQGAGYSVSVDGDDQLSGYSLMYDSSKQRVVGSLPIGSYDIRVSGGGQTQSTGTGKVEVTASEVKASTIALYPSGTITFRVQLDYSAKQPDATRAGLAPSYSGGNNMGPARTNTASRSLSVTLYPADSLLAPGVNMGGSPGKSDDELVLSNVRDGRYWVWAMPQHGYVASLTSGGVDLMREPLVMEPNSSSEPIYVTLRDDGAKLSGTITGINLAQAQAHPTGIGNFIVLCIPMDGYITHPAFPFYTNGRFSYANLAPARYLVLAMPMSLMKISQQLQSVEYRDENVMRQLIPKGTVVTLEAGQSAEIQVPLLPDEDN
jgi:hypothetical protein